MKKLLFVAVVAMGIVHEAHAMVAEKGKQQQCIEIIKRKIIKLNAPNFSAEAQIEYDDILKEREQHLVNFDEKIDKHNKKLQVIYNTAKQKLDTSKERVKEKFGQDIFLAPIHDIDVLNMYAHYARLNRFNENFSAEAAVIENKRKRIEEPINAFKNPETRERYFKLFRREKLKNMTCAGLKRAVYKDKMNRE